jgi:hypothetical protein
MGDLLLQARPIFLRNVNGYEIPQAFYSTAMVASVFYGWMRSGPGGTEFDAA